MSTSTENSSTTFSLGKEDTTKKEESVLPMEGIKKKHTEQPKSYVLQYVLLFLLVFQNSSVILTTRYSRIVSGDLYLTTTAVFLAEILKLFICTTIMFYQTGSAAGVEIIEIFTLKYVDTLKMSVPAILYVFQNNLLYVAASNLDAAVFQFRICLCDIVSLDYIILNFN
ncbi:hypothetical protein LOD99_4961 [Oopsacas minuta]|uniref:Uncharacterized protein n=1 Tax=Oopsacas minuta TaxID=111878 RepID=A0AAV7JSJ2_9METZ|nr:hypothetical protein LOD99_4961 [Oopsacas minuta]